MANRITRTDAKGNVSLISLHKAAQRIHGCFMADSLITLKEIKQGLKDGCVYVSESASYRMETKQQERITR